MRGEPNLHSGAPRSYHSVAGRVASAKWFTAGHKMDNEQRVAYTRAMKEEYEAEPMQQALIAQDYGKVAAQQMKKQVVAKKKHSRFHRELQRRAGTKQFWEVISYTGRTPFQIF